MLHMNKMLGACSFLLNALPLRRHAASHGAPSRPGGDRQLSGNGRCGAANLHMVSLHCISSLKHGFTDASHHLTPLLPPFRESF